MEKLGRQAVKLALECEQATTDKAQAKGMPCGTVPHIKYMLKMAQSGAALFPGAGIGSDVAAAADAAAAGEMVADNAVDKCVAWQAAGKAGLKANSDASTVIEAYLNAFECGSQLKLAELKEQQYIPLESFITASKLLANQGRFEDMLALLLFGCTVYTSASLFMLIGVSCIRLDKLQDAEDALVEANLLDNRNADIWGYLCMVCLLTGPHRLEESERALSQALRLQLGTTALLRELAMAYAAVDKLSIAEDLVRRAITSEEGSSSSSGSRGSRKLLADILAGQNNAAMAVEEYQTVIEDDNGEPNVRVEAAHQCAALLTSLGRDDEVKTIKKIISALTAPPAVEEDAAPPAADVDVDATTDAVDAVDAQ
jgi:tetratricopeptide (TPR) repeat protein